MQSENQCLSLTSNPQTLRTSLHQSDAFNRILLGIIPQRASIPLPYLNSKNLNQTDSLSDKNLHPHLLIKERLKISIFLTPNPPSLCGRQIFSQLTQHTFRTPSFFPHKKSR